MRLTRLALAVVACLSFAASALALDFKRQGPYAFERAADFGMRASSTIGQISTSYLAVSAFTVAEAVAVRATVGGVLFLGVAEPDPSVSGQPITLRYSPERPDGQRLSISIGDVRVVTQPVYDWFLLPISAYVDSPHNGSVTLFDRPRTSDELAFDRAYPGLFWVNYHAALVNTVVGFNLFLVDAMLVARNPEAMKNATSIINIDIPNYTTIPARSGDRAAQAIKSMLEKHYVAAYSYMFTDFDVTYSVGIKNNMLQLTGSPYYVFFDLSLDDDNAIVDSLTTELKGKSYLLYELNQRVFKTAADTARWAVFFRHVKKKWPDAWKLFVMELKRAPPVLSVATPRAWQPPSSRPIRLLERPQRQGGIRRRDLLNMLERMQRGGAPIEREGFPFRN